MHGGNGRAVHVVLPAYRATRTIPDVVAEMPLEEVDRALLIDDASPDATSAVALEQGLEVLRHPANRGYGASQKTGYVRALRDGAKVIVMVHADNQYDPGLVAEMAAPILAGDADIVIGSRLLVDRAVAGGMPRWKWLGNRLLTGIENRAFGVRFSEYHTGYRAFSADFLRSIPFLRNSDDFVFDQEIFAQMLARGARVQEIPIPTRYFHEASSVDFLTSVRVRAQDPARAGALPARSPLGAAAAPRRMHRRIAALILLAALVIRVAWVLQTPDYELVHDALDYDNHAYSIAAGEWYALSHGRSTAFRPPLYPFFLGGVYWVSGVELEPDRIEVARLANAVVGTGIVALIGLLALQLWGRREALVAMALAAVYVPLITVGQSVMSEPLATLFLLGAIAAALRRWALLAGVLAGLAILGRPNAIILLLPLAVAVWRGPKPALVLVVAAALTVVPWTIRNTIVLDHFVPVSTQLGSALAGTYNSDARGDRENPASWRSHQTRQRLRAPLPPHPHDQRGGARDESCATGRWTSSASTRATCSRSAFWTSRRMLDLAGMDWSIHTASTISAGRRAAIWGVACFWIYAVLAVIGAFTRRARAAPLWFWAMPVLMWLSVMFLVVETPRYRTAIDPFIILLAALALASLWKNRPRRSDGPAPDPDRRVPHGGHAAAG